MCHNVDGRYLSICLTRNIQRVRAVVLNMQPSISVFRNQTFRSERTKIFDFQTSSCNNQRQISRSVYKELHFDLRLLVVTYSQATCPNLSRKVSNVKHTSNCLFSCLPCFNPPFSAFTYVLTSNCQQLLLDVLSLANVPTKHMNLHSLYMILPSNLTNQTISPSNLTDLASNLSNQNLNAM